MAEEFYTYVLYSRQFDKIYIGSTSNLQARFLAHNQLANKGWTIRYRPWEILFHESFSTKADAMKREKQLKSFRGRVYIRERINKQD